MFPAWQSDLSQASSLLTLIFVCVFAESIQSTIFRVSLAEDSRRTLLRLPHKVNDVVRLLLQWFKKNKQVRIISL